MKTESAALALAIGVLAAGGAAAQSCERPDQSHIVCRFVSSRPEPLRVVARGWVRRTGGPASGELALSVDGTPCEVARLRSHRRIGVVEAGCHGSNAVVTHVAVAELRNVQGAEPAGVLVGVEDSARLSHLPREEADLSGPPPPRRPWPNPLRHVRLPHLRLPHIGS